MSGGINPIPTTPIADRNGMLTTLWQALFSSIHNFLGPVGTSGPTSQRPINSTQNPLYIGQSFFDTTLGLPIWVKSLNPTVWEQAVTVPAAVVGVEQTIFYTLGYAPATSQSADVTMTPVLSSLSNRYLITHIYILAAAATQVAGSAVLNIWTGASKTGTKLTLGTISANTLNSLSQWQYADDGGCAIADIVIGANAALSATPNTAFVSMSAAGTTGSGTYDIFLQGYVLPFGP